MLHSCMFKRKSQTEDNEGKRDGELRPEIFHGGHRNVLSVGTHVNRQRSYFTNRATPDTLLPLAISLFASSSKRWSLLNHIVEWPLVSPAEGLLAHCCHTPLPAPYRYPPIIGALQLFTQATLRSVSGQPASPTSATPAADDNISAHHAAKMSKMRHPCLSPCHTKRQFDACI